MAVGGRIAESPAFDGARGRPQAQTAHDPVGIILIPLSAWLDTGDKAVGQRNAGHDLIHLRPRGACPVHEGLHGQEFARDGQCACARALSDTNAYNENYLINNCTKIGSSVAAICTRLQEKAG